MEPEALIERPLLIADQLYMLWGAQQGVVLRGTKRGTSGRKRNDQDEPPEDEILRDSVAESVEKDEEVQFDEIDADPKGDVADRHGSEPENHVFIHCR